MVKPCAPSWSNTKLTRKINPWVENCLFFGKASLITLQVWRLRMR